MANPMAPAAASAGAETPEIAADEAGSKARRHLHIRHTEMHVSAQMTTTRVNVPPVPVGVAPT
jgi:hypothetical protein